MIISVLVMMVGQQFQPRLESGETLWKLGFPKTLGRSEISKESMGLKGWLGCVRYFMGMKVPL
jgi:hypothetical protein